MNDATILDTLRQTEFLSGIGEEHLQRLAEISRYVEYPARADIFRENEAAKDVYVILSGRVSLVICQPKVGCRQLMEASEGQLIGWSPLVGRHLLSGTAHTMEPTTVAVIDGERLLALCQQLPELGFQIMHRTAQILGQRLNATRLRLLEMGGHHLPEYQIESD